MIKSGYTPEEVKEITKTSKAHIYRQMESGNIPFVQLGRRKTIPAWWVEKNFGEPELVDQAQEALAEEFGKGLRLTRK